MAHRARAGRTILWPSPVSGGSQTIKVSRVGKRGHFALWPVVCARRRRRAELGGGPCSTPLLGRRLQNGPSPLVAFVAAWSLLGGDHASGCAGGHRLFGGHQWRRIG